MGDPCFGGETRGCNSSLSSLLTSWLSVILSRLLFVFQTSLFLHTKSYPWYDLMNLDSLNPPTIDWFILIRCGSLVQTHLDPSSADKLFRTQHITVWYVKKQRGLLDVVRFWSFGMIHYMTIWLVTWQMQKRYGLFCIHKQYLGVRWSLGWSATIPRPGRFFVAVSGCSRSAVD